MSGKYWSDRLAISLRGLSGGAWIIRSRDGLQDIHRRPNGFWALEIRAFVRLHSMEDILGHKRNRDYLLVKFRSMLSLS